MVNSGDVITSTALDEHSYGHAASCVSALPVESASAYRPLRASVKIPLNLMVQGDLHGDPSETRTPDTLIKSQVLCQLS